MDKKISIIISCHHIENSIDDCYQALKKQTIGLEHLELIFICGPSSDTIWNRLLDIESDCPDSVMLIKQEEACDPGAAYNIGLHYAIAAFVSFINNDCLADYDAYEQLYKAAMENHCDVISCNGKEKELIYLNSIHDRKQFLLLKCLKNDLDCKLIRKDILLEHELYFPEQISCADGYSDIFYPFYVNRILILKEKLFQTNTDWSADTDTPPSADLEDHHDFLFLNLIKWDDWKERGLSVDYPDELGCLFLHTGYLCCLKNLLLKKNPVSFETFELLKREITARIPAYTQNPFITTKFTPFEQLLLSLLKLPITNSDLNQIALSAKTNWQKISIFVATHVSFQPPENKIYIPLHVGRADKEDLGYLGDHTGDNISHLNKYYSELTGLYWLWKNYHHADYVGLCHYRRYFMNEDGSLLNKEDYIRILSSYDVIISKPSLYQDENCRQQYGKAHNINDLAAVERAISKLYPEYLTAFHEAMEGYRIYHGNLFAASRQIVNAYSKWLFTLFEAVSEEIHPESYDAYHKRVYGFISEQLLFVWIKAQGLKWYECSIGFSQEKAESIELKSTIFNFLQRKSFKDARQYIHNYLKDRPDVLLETADITKTLPLLYQLVNIGLHDPETSLIRDEDTLNSLLDRYRYVLAVLKRLCHNEITEEDILFIAAHSISKPTLNAIIEATPSYANVNLKLLFPK